MDLLLLHPVTSKLALSASGLQVIHLPVPLMTLEIPPWAWTPPAFCLLSLPFQVRPVHPQFAHGALPTLFDAFAPATAPFRHSLPNNFLNHSPARPVIHRPLFGSVRSQVVTTQMCTLTFVLYALAI